MDCIVHTCAAAFGAGNCEDGNDVDWDGCTDGQISELKVNLLEGAVHQKPDVAVVSDNSIAVVWQCQVPPGSGEYDIFIRPFFAGEGLGYGDDVVNANTQAGNQVHPGIAALKSGGVVVSWLSTEQDGQERIMARSYDGAFAPLGDEFEVVSAAEFGLCCPAVAAHQANHDFVVTWGMSGFYDPGYDVVARRYSGAGDPEGTQFLVNSLLALDQNYPAVGATPIGNLVVAWETPSGYADATNVNFQIYDGSGIAAGDEQDATTPSPVARKSPAVGYSDLDGNFVLAWARCPSSQPGSEGLGDGSGCGVFAHLYGPAGDPLGDELQVNLEIENDQEEPDVDGRHGSGFVMAWQSDMQDGDVEGVYVRAFAQDGTTATDEIRANTYVTDQQLDPAVAGMTDGGFVVVWAGDSMEFAYTAIYLQRFDAEGQKLYY